MRLNLCLAVLLSAASLAGATISYSYEKLDIDYVGSWSQMNNHGWMAGVASNFDDGRNHPARYRPGVGVEQLSNYSGQAYDINDAGTAVGYFRQSGVIKAFVRPKGEPLTDIGTFGGRESHAFAINEAGQVVGRSRTSEGAYHAFVYSAADGMRDLGTLGGSRSVAIDINESGQILGRSRIMRSSESYCPPQDCSVLAGVEHTFLYDPTLGMIDINALVGAPFVGLALSDNGTIAGNVGDYLAVFSLSTGLGRLGTLGAATAINDRGWIVGEGPDDDGFLRPFLYVDGQGIMELNTLVGLDTEISEPIDINDRDQILTRSGYGGMYLLSPIPEPSTWLLLGAGLSGVVLAHLQQTKHCKDGRRHGVLKLALRRSPRSNAVQFSPVGPHPGS